MEVPALENLRGVPSTGFDTNTVDPNYCSVPGSLRVQCRGAIPANWGSLGIYPNDLLHLEAKVAIGIGATPQLPTDAPAIETTIILHHQMQNNIWN